MKHVYRILTVMLVIAALVGCQQTAATPAPLSGNTEAPAAEADAAPGWQRSDLDRISWLALGTLRLEGTTDALTPDQARELLPLWQIVQGGALKSATESDAVTRQIETKMTASQLAAIEVLDPTAEDLQVWMAEQGIQMPARAEGQNVPGTAGDLSEGERAKAREQLQNMSAEERATRMAEMGIQRPAGQEGAGPAGTGRGMSQAAPVFGLLVELLTARAAG